MQWAMIRDGAMLTLGRKLTPSTRATYWTYSHDTLELQYSDMQVICRAACITAAAVCRDFVAMGTPTVLYIGDPIIRKARGAQTRALGLTCGNSRLVVVADQGIRVLDCKRPFVVLFNVVYASVHDVSLWPTNGAAFTVLYRDDQAIVVHSDGSVDRYPAQWRCHRRFADMPVSSMDPCARNARLSYQPAALSNMVLLLLFVHPPLPQELVVLIRGHFIINPQ
jgi:hypothetical protein